MQLDFGAVKAIYRTELRMMLRDRRTIILSIVLPILIMPVMMFFSHKQQAMRQHKLQASEFRVAVAGNEPDAARAWLERALTERAAPTERAAGTKNEPPARFRVVTVKDEDKAIENGETDVLVAIAAPPAPKDAGAKDAGAKDAEAKAGSDDEARPDPEAPVPGAPALEVRFRADKDTSTAARERLLALFRTLRASTRDTLLQTSGVGVKAADVGRVEESNVAKAGQVAGSTMGRMLTMLLMFFMMSGGAVVATDTLAGEKERGTLETLLTTAASRAEIITAKQLLVLSVALVITLIQVLNFAIYAGLKVIPVAPGFAASVTPVTVVLVLLLFLPVAALVSGALLYMSARAKSHKEAQLYFFPLMLCGVVPALAPFLPGISLRSAIAVVPIANVAVAVKEILTGTIDLPMILVAFAVTTAAAVGTAIASTKSLSAERLITANDRDEADALGGPPLFARHVLTWFAVLWAVLFASSAWTEGKLGIRGQILLNLGVLFLGASILMLRRYRLPLRETLSLRAPHPLAWLATLIGAPAGLVAAVGLVQLVSVFLPVPPEMVKAFSKELMPPDMSFAELILFVAVLPGVIEEITFRGVLLSGLTRRLSPVPRALAVGLIFGLFHVALFRIAPTAVLGVMLATVVLLTGSIFPAMLWHALNNGLALASGRYGYDLEQFGAARYVIATVVLALAFGILWRFRRRTG